MAFAFAPRTFTTTTCSRAQYYSVGGGFVIGEEDGLAQSSDDSGDQPHPFTSAQELLHICDHYQLSMADVVHSNELARHDEQEISQKLDKIWQVMHDCIERGCHTSGILPGVLKIRRRAPLLYERLTGTEVQPHDPLTQMDWVTMFALAVNEENAAGGPRSHRTNQWCRRSHPSGVGLLRSFHARFYASGPAPVPEDGWCHRHAVQAQRVAVGRRDGLPRRSGRGVFHAAAGLAAVMGGSPRQVENAAEIGMEHNLGLTCDPIAGLVQIPCIERNTMGAVKAINAARLAVLYGDGTHRVPLDQVIETMRQTGVDMQSKYKETSQGGLAVNVVDC